MARRQCGVCGRSYVQSRGRPSETCPACRTTDPARYGSAHKAYRRATLADAIGSPCVRCGVILTEDDELHLDHLDGGGPGDYAGWSHGACNTSAGAARGNRMRAAAYNATRGVPVQVKEVTCAFHQPVTSCCPHSRSW